MYKTWNVSKVPFSISISKYNFRFHTRFHSLMINMKFIGNLNVFAYTGKFDIKRKIRLLTRFHSLRINMKIIGNSSVFAYTEKFGFKQKIRLLTRFYSLRINMKIIGNVNVFAYTGKFEIKRQIRLPCIFLVHRIPKEKGVSILIDECSYNTFFFKISTKLVL